MVVHLFLNNNKALDFLPINSIKNGGITGDIQIRAMRRYLYSLICYEKVRFHQYKDYS